MAAAGVTVPSFIDITLLDQSSTRVRKESMRVHSIFLKKDAARVSASKKGLMGSEKHGSHYHRSAA